MFVRVIWVEHSSDRLEHAIARAEPVAACDAHHTPELRGVLMLAARRTGSSIALGRRRRHGNQGDLSAATVRIERFGLAPTSAL
jgi:hypothetical protein